MKVTEKIELEIPVPEEVMERLSQMDDFSVDIDTEQLLIRFTQSNEQELSSSPGIEESTVVMTVPGELYHVLRQMQEPTAMLDLDSVLYLTSFSEREIA